MVCHSLLAYLSNLDATIPQDKVWDSWSVVKNSTCGDKLEMTNPSQSPQPLTLETAAVGWAALDAKDYSAALAFFEPYRSDPIGQYFIGLIYIKDETLRDRKLEGVELLKRSAEADTFFAWLALGNYYADEEGGSQDIKQAFKWYEKGAEYGCSRCQANLGWCCCRLEDFATAAKWLFISAVLGAEKGKDLFNLLFVVATSEQYEEGCREGMEWLETKRDVDESRLHPELRQWLSVDREFFLSVERDLFRIRTQISR